MRVFFRRSCKHHSRNDSSSGTSSSNNAHVFSHSRTLVVPGTFMRVLYNNIHHHVVFARESEEKEKRRTGPISSTFHFSFSCGIVYPRGNRTPESEKKQTSVYLIKRKMKKKFWYTYQVRIISPFVVALAAGVNSNPSSRERLLRTANPRQHPNSCIHG